MILYVPVPYKEEDECNFSPCTSYLEAKGLGEEFYQEGYDIEEVDTEE